MHTHAHTRTDGRNGILWWETMPSNCGNYFLTYFIHDCQPSMGSQQQMEYVRAGNESIDCDVEMCRECAHCSGQLGARENERQIFSSKRSGDTASLNCKRLLRWHDTTHSFICNHSGRVFLLFRSKVRCVMIFVHAMDITSPCLADVQSAPPKI